MRVDGAVEISFSGVHSVELVALERVGGDFVLQDLPFLERLELPALREVAGRLVLQGAGELWQPQFGALQRVLAGLMVSDCPRLEALQLPALEAVGAGGDDAPLLVSGCGRLARIAAPVLLDVGGFVQMYRLHALVALELPRLAALTGTLHLAYCPAIEVLSPWTGEDGWTPRVRPRIFEPGLATFAHQLDLVEVADAPCRPCATRAFKSYSGAKRCS